MNEQLRERCRYIRPLENAPTRHIILRGRESDLLDLRETLYRHGAVKITSPEPSRGYHCFASFDSITDAKACLESISKQNQSSISVKYADIEDADEKKENEKEKDQRNGGLHAAYLTAQDCDIPGLELIPDFVTEEEETALLTEIDSLPWNQLARRRVQHYGKVFDYTVCCTVLQVVSCQSAC